MNWLLMTGKINVMIWNYRGAGKQNFGAFLIDLRQSYGFYILVLFEPRLSGLRTDKIGRNFGFDGIFRVDYEGFAKGIWIFLGLLYVEC